MNVERLYAISQAVYADIQSGETETTLQQLVDALQNQVNQPQSPEFQQQVSQYLQTLYEALSNSKSNDFSPAWKQALQELGMDALLGNNLRARIQEIFERNQITPSVALDELKEILSSLTAYKTSLENINSSFALMKIGAEELESGQSEIGVLLPRIAVRNRLREFSKELEEIDSLLATFAELSTGKRPGFTIRSLSSSDFTVFLDALPVITASLAIAVERIISLYKNLLDIRIRHKELKAIGLKDAELKGVKSHADKLMKDGIEILVRELMDKYYKKQDEGRRNEMTTDLRFALNKIAKRIDKGYNIEVRVSPLSPEEEAEGKTAAKEKEHIDTILSASKTLEFMKIEGEPLLNLPEAPKTKKKGTKSQ